MKARALDPRLSCRKISPRDAIPIATMEAAGIGQILSTDTGFDGLKEIRRIDPAQFLT
jgi:predicted nucleic acid-binding protein